MHLHREPRISGEHILTLVREASIPTREVELIVGSREASPEERALLPRVGFINQDLVAYLLVTELWARHFRHEMENSSPERVLGIVAKLQGKCAECHSFLKRNKHGTAEWKYINSGYLRE